MQNRFVLNISDITYVFYLKMFQNTPWNTQRRQVLKYNKQYNKQRNCLPVFHVYNKIHIWAKTTFVYFLMKLHYTRLMRHHSKQKLDSSAAAVPEDNVKFTKNSPTISKAKFQKSVPQFFCILAHQGRI